MRMFTLKVEYGSDADDQTEMAARKGAAVAVFAHVLSEHAVRFT